MRKNMCVTAGLALLLLASAVAAQQPELIPPPQAAQPGQAQAQPRVPGFQQLQKFLFPEPLKSKDASSLKGAKALYQYTLDLWKDNGLVFMNKEKGELDSSKAGAWHSKWMARKDEIKDDNDFATADLLVLAALEDLGERFNYYLTPDEVNSENKHQDPTSVGIGARFELEGMEELLAKLPKNASEEDYEKALVVDSKHRLSLTPVKGSPAEKAGLLKGDVLKSVDGEAVDGKTLRAIVMLIKGRQGSPVVLEVVRTKDGKEETVKIRITRQPFTSPVVHADEFDNDILYLKLDHFSADNTLIEMNRELREVAKQKLEKKRPVKLILDLRNNPGGRLDFAVNIVSYMLPEGNIVTLKERQENKLQVTRWSATRDALIYSYPAPVAPQQLIAIQPQKRELLLPEDVPLVILINHNSASASELTSRCLQYYKRAVIVGESSRGKGVGQQVYTLPENRRGKVIKFTFCPADQDIDWQGVHPNTGWEVKWKNPTRRGEDNQLEAAKLAVIAEYNRIEKEKADAQAKKDEAVKKNKEEFEKQRARTQEELKRQAQEREEKSKGKGAGQPGNAPSTPGQPNAPGAQPGTQPNSTPSQTPAGSTPKGEQPGVVPKPGSGQQAPPVMPPAPEDE